MTKHTIWLHIGIRKTGSTAIQDFLCRNQKNMLEAGYDYPTDFSPEAIKSLQLGMLGLPQCGNINHVIKNIFANPNLSFSQMIENLKIPNNKDVILSSENFYFLGLNESMLKTFQNALLAKTKNHKIKVICYLRRQDELLESLYRQVMQDANSKDYKFKNEFLDDSDTKCTLEFSKFIILYAKLFGKENLIIRPFEKEQLKDNNIVADFLSIIGMKNTNSLDLNLASNISFDHKIVEYIRLSKTYIPDLHKVLTNYLSKQNIKTKTSSISMVPPQIKLDYAKNHEQMNNKIAKDYLGKEKLFLKPLPKVEKNWAPYDMTAEDAVQVSSLLFQSVIKKMYTLQDDINKIKTVLQELLKEKKND